MTQATQASPPPPAGQPTGQPTGQPAVQPASQPQEKQQARMVDVPALLNRWQAIAVTACLVFGVLTAVLQVLSWNANRAAADDTEQLVRVQSIQSTLLRADSLATSAFLVGGLEPPAQRAAYDDAIDTVTQQVAEAAEAQSADRDALAALNQAVTSYATTVTQARDNNRQGFPVGSAYLSDASSGLRADALPIVSALVTANSARAEDEMSAQRPWFVVLPGLLALALLWWLNSKLSAVFRRRFNVGLATAFVGIAVLTLVALVVSIGQRSDNNGLRAGSYKLAVDGATARSAGNDARANESLRLINRGSGAAFEDAYVAGRATVETHVIGGTLDLWTTYDTLHTEVVTLDESGQWDQAVAQATGPGSTGAFDAFDEAVRSDVDVSARSATRELRNGNSAILVLAGVSLLVGLAAAGICTRGIAARRKEYS
jgi:hypothetical protein